MIRLAAALAIFALPSLGQAQSVDCSNPQTQFAMNTCAARDYERADEELNRVYQIARDRLQEMDQYGVPDGEVAAAIALRDAQRAWIPYRDLACEAESLLVRGGSMQPMMLFGCLAAVTQQRTENLKVFLNWPN